MPGMGGYTLVTSGSTKGQGPTEPGFINGGMLSGEDSPARCPVIVVVESMDATLERISGLGGAVVSPRASVGNMGVAARVTDPEGSVVGRWETARS
jgi:predicted enzyme related to lactoylglutathione lyase